MWLNGLTCLPAPGLETSLRLNTTYDNETNHVKEKIKNEIYHFKIG